MVHPPLQAGGAAPREVASVALPTPYGQFQARAFETATGHVHLALVFGSVGDGTSLLTRLHSECLTGDAIGSLRCDCGVQLRTALRAVAAEGRGVVLYLNGHEGRGIGLVDKLRAYVEQDAGADTVDANLRLGLHVDLRDYGDAAAILSALGVASVRLLSNNPAKADALLRHGIAVESLRSLSTAAHRRNRAYLETKQVRLGHRRPTGEQLTEVPGTPVDVGALLGPLRPLADRPRVVLKYAQTLDGRIATRTGDARWISGEAERRVAHAMRAGCDAVLVGARTVLQDDPQLTVRMVPGASPLRVVLDTRLRTPLSAKVLSDDAATLILCGPGADPARRRGLVAGGATVREVAGGPSGLRVDAVLRLLRSLGVVSLLVEGGGRVITSMLRAAAVDRVVVSLAPMILGAGVDAVGPLGTTRVADGVRLVNRSVYLAGDDVLLGYDVHPAPAELP
ncbi:GTP cyclohydrolase II RibA [Geodermatophilus ruber]|uniref:GTP cyclohydrolase-2 n=1 Tax=Geodermatophilus ruber TaxID=504800 RepID=A0A1I4IMV7_9ACTN|nr:GTP cyclohydrolase II RibA [Geodermatophilus ruber]SFL55682.1 3,4-dihydroxy 2-butanone 4-phosphate synthase / GTP cyclohydrolase II [Geodermatophilus ruber]